MSNIELVEDFVFPTERTLVYAGKVGPLWGAAYGENGSFAQVIDEYPNTPEGRRTALDILTSALPGDPPLAAYVDGGMS